MEKVIKKYSKVIKKMIFIISLFLITTKVNAVGYNYASFKWEDFAEQYQDYWTSTCELEEDTGKCVEQTLKTQKKFFKKLYKMLASYERSGLYIKDEIIVGTLYYGLSPDAFRDDNAFYIKWFENIAFDFDSEDDNITVDEDEGISILDEANSIKLLIKAMVGYEATCSKIEPASYQTNNDYQEPYCNQGNLIKNSDGTYSCKSLISTKMVNYGEKLLNSISILNIFGIRSNDKQECIDAGGTYNVSNKKTVNESAYWAFLEESNYFDTKPHFAYRFAHIIEDTEYENMEELDNAMDNNDDIYNKYHEQVLAERKEIILEIKECLDLFNQEHPENAVYFSSISNTYYYPIGSNEIEEINGKKYAKGTPINSYIIKDYNPGTNDGIDIVTFNVTANVIAIKDGIVSKVINTCTANDSTCASGYGNMITISHSDGTYSSYAYLSNIEVAEGQSVSQGEVIGQTGQTGEANENSLHFEIKISTGSRVNPNTYISSTNPRPTSTTVSTIVGGTNTESVCLTLKQSGASSQGIAAVMANINHESGFNPMNLENSYETKLGYTDQTYTTAVDLGTYTNFANDSAGYGLCQWTYKTRKLSLLSKAKEQGVTIGDTGLQISFLLQELQAGHTSLYNAIMTGSESTESIASNFCHNFENPYDHTQCDTTRANSALSYYSYVESGCK